MHDVDRIGERHAVEEAVFDPLHAAQSTGDVGVPERISRRGRQARGGQHAVATTALRG